MGLRSEQLNLGRKVPQLPHRLLDEHLLTLQLLPNHPALSGIEAHRGPCCCPSSTRGRPLVLQYQLCAAMLQGTQLRGYLVAQLLLKTPQSHVVGLNNVRTHRMALGETAR